MRRGFKFLALGLSLIFNICIFGGCSEDNNVSTGDSFTYWVQMDVNASQTQNSFNDLLMYKEMEKATGTKVEFIHPSKGTNGSEAFQILMASGDYPDMIEYWWLNYTGGPDQAIADGVIISLNDYMKDYAPNYYNYMEGEAGKEKNYSYKISALSNAGNYYGFKNLNIGKYKGYAGLYVRKDLLDKWNLNVPETIDEWEHIFKTAKENGIKYPLTGAKYLFANDAADLFNTAWGVSNGFYLDGKKVKFGPFEDEYKSYIAKMREWVQKGYIDIDYITNDNITIRGQMTNGNSIASFGYIGGDLGTLLPAMLERDPDYDLVACPYPVMTKGDKPVFQPIQPDSSDPTLAISTQCGKDNEERYKEAISWCDYLYSDEGIVLKCFGVEGDTYTVEKGENDEERYVYTDKIFNYDDIGATNIAASLFHYFLPANHPGFNQHPDYFNGFYAYEQQKDAIEVWNKHVDVAQKYVFPTVSYTGEEASKKANIETRAKSELAADLSNIILGKAPMSDYDKAIKKVKEAGYDELLKINQAAYERYLSALK